MDVRLIATDLDGTLLRSDGSISQRTTEALARCAAEGMTLVLATARPLRWVHPLAQRIGHSGLAVCTNGAVVYDVRAERITARRCLPSATVSQLIDGVRHAVPEATFGVETVADGFGHEPGHVPITELGATATVGPITELVTEDVVKLHVQHRGMSVDQLRVATAAVTDGVVEVTSSGEDGLLEISAKGVTKASTLAELAAQMGVSPANTVAFGDMPNDIGMLRWAGTSYAVANAHSDVLAAAHHIAPSNDEDGVAVVLARLLDAVQDSSGRGHPV